MCYYFSFYTKHKTPAKCLSAISVVLTFNPTDFYWKCTNSKYQYFWYMCDFSNRLVIADLSFTQTNVPGSCCGIFPGLNWCAFCALMSIYCVCGIDCTACMCVVMTEVSPCAIVWLSDVFLIVCAKQWMLCGKNKRSSI